jgi:hypothetical protein
LSCACQKTDPVRLEFDVGQRGETTLEAEAATVVTFNPCLREAAGSQGLFVVPPST